MALPLESAVIAPAKPLLTLFEGTAETRDPDAVDFLRASGLPLSSVVLALFDQSDDCIKVLDIEGNLKFMNCNGRQSMEVDDFGTIAGCSWDAMWPTDSQAAVNDAVAQAKLGQSSRFEAFCPTAKGTPRWWDVSVSPILSPGGKVEAILSSSRNITSRKINEQSMETMLKEMQHRLRNAYAVGSAIVSMSARENPAIADYAASVSSRLASVAEIQSAMVDVKDVSITDVLTRIVEAFDDRGVATLSALPDIRLDESEARALALVVSELCANSLKHGALSGRGVVSISGQLDGQQLHIDWIEHHSTQRDGPVRTSSGLGKGIMSTMLKIIGGTIESSVLRHGYRARLSIKAA